MRKDGTDTYVDLTRLPYIATSSYVGVPSRDKRRRPRISLHVTHLSTSTHRAKYIVGESPWHISAARSLSDLLEYFIRIYTQNPTPIRRQLLAET
eukprot:scaffold6689_cov79-Skeletonema_dohrnii-CCMP3373.AAC.2